MLQHPAWSRKGEPVEKSMEAIASAFCGGTTVAAGQQDLQSGRRDGLEQERIRTECKAFL